MSALLQIESLICIKSTNSASTQLTSVLLGNYEVSPSSSPNHRSYQSLFKNFSIDTSIDNTLDLSVLYVSESGNPTGCATVSHLLEVEIL